VEQLTIGIDIGGTNLRFALVNDTGTIVYRSRTASGIADGRAGFCGRLLAGIDELSKVAELRNGCITGIGAGVPGLIGRDGLINSSVNMRPLDGFNLAAFLTEETGYPSACGNDANMIALGEQAFGAGRRFSSFLVITIGTGLGSGLILDGQLWNGAGGFAAEFGHVTLEPDGLPCPCGNHGCLERYVSAGALVRTAQELLPLKLLDMGGDQLDAEMVADLAREGESGALETFQIMGRRLGIALASLLNILDLEAVIIGGGVAASFDLFLPALSVEVGRRCFPQIAADLLIVKGELGDDAGLLGGGALAARLKHGR